MKATFSPPEQALRDSQQPLIIKWSGHELDTEGQSVGMRTRGERDGRCARKVGLHGEDVLQVHGHGVADVAVREGGGGASGR